MQTCDLSIFRYFLLFAFLFIFLQESHSQIKKINIKYTVYGSVKDSVSGETLPYANVFEMQGGGACITNDYGFYSLTLQNGPVKLRCSYVGYKDKIIDFKLKNDTIINIGLVPAAEQLDEVIITDTVENQLFRSQISIQNLPLKEIKKLPVLLGEPDVLKSIQLLPGIQSGHEGSSGIYVRGGSGDQNLFIIDGTPVYRVYHLMGFVSMFNEDAVSSVQVYTGAFPARYHGRLASVIDVTTKEGNLYKYQGGFSIGLLAAKFNVNGPVKKGKGSFFISGRRSYFNWLARPVIKSLADGAVVNLYFYDLNGKINYTVTDKDRIYLSIYFGKDVYNKKSEESGISNGEDYYKYHKDGLKWGNLVSSLRWNHVWNNKLFSNLIFSYSRYQYVNEQSHKNETTGNKNDYQYQLQNGIYDLTGRFAFDWFPIPGHTVKYGVEYIYRTFIPGITAEYISEQGENSFRRDTTYGYNDIYANEFTAFIEDTWKIKKRWVIRPGISATAFSSTGKTWITVEPRLSVNYLINKSFFLKAAYARMSQFMHLLRFSTINLPTDLWIPAMKEFPPELSDQYTLGVFYELKNMFEFSVEAYYKSMNNLVEYKEGASFFQGDNSWESKIETGKGWSYGVEFMVKKKVGRLTGWVNYTWAKSERLFDDINFGEPFPFRFDRRNDLAIAGVYQINEKIDFGLTWVFGTGYPVTMMTAKYASYFLSAFNGKSVPSGTFVSVNYYPYRNNYRMPAFHHLDVNFNFHKKTKYGERIVSAGVYNIYNRLNAFYLEERDGKLYKVSLFPILPFVRFTLKFY